MRPRSELTRIGSVASTRLPPLGGQAGEARITGATNSWNVKIADVGKPGRITTGLPSVTARQIGLPGLSATPWATMPGLREPADDAVREIAGALRRAAREDHDVALRGRARARSSSAVFVVGNDAEMHRLAAELLDGGADDRGVGVVDRARAQRIAGRDDLVAGREDRHARPAVDARPRARPSAASTPISREVSSCPARSTVSPRAMSVPA